MARAWPDKRFTALVGCAHPIVQAPMAGAVGPAMAQAVIAAGGLGSLPCGMITPEKALTDAATVGGGPLNMNFFCHSLPEDSDPTAWRALLAAYDADYAPDYSAPPPPVRAPFGEAMCAVVEQVRPAAVSFHFGLPDERLVTRVRASGAKVIGNATSVAEAVWLAERGCDAIIAQGLEAGGHAGWFLPAHPAARLGIFALIPQVTDAVQVPVIAAGGIGDARGIAAAMMLGASAVQIGTAYLHSPESLISAAHRKALASEAARRTVATNLFTGGNARAIPNRLIDDLGPVNGAVPAYPDGAAVIAPLRRAAEAKGDPAFTPLWSGQSAPLCRSMPAAELTRTLAGEALALLNGDAR